MSLEDFKSYEETAYLMSSIKNAERLNQAIEQLEKGKGKHKKLMFVAQPINVEWDF